MVTIPQRSGLGARRRVRLVDAFQTQFAAVANALQGSGWAVLGYDTLGDNLPTFPLYDQQANMPLGIVPLLQVDIVGARTLLAVQERESRLRQGILECRKLAGRSTTLPPGHQGGGCADGRLAPTFKNSRRSGLRVGHQQTYVGG